MSDRWLYRIFGQEFGPVSLDLVKTLVAAGTIAPDDEVRNATQSNWILACSASELNGAIQTPVAELLAERRAVRDEWYCRGASGEVGPLSLSDLIQLAAEGDLLPDEEIKSKADDQWKQLRSIRRLVDLLPFLKEDPNIALTQSSPFGDAILRLTESVMKNSNSTHSTVSTFEDIIPFPLPKSTADRIGEGNAVASLSESTTRLTATSTVNLLSVLEVDDCEGIWDRHEKLMSTSDATWTGWMSGQEFGPVDFPQLLMWAVTGQLLPMDFVQRGADGQYVPAVNIPCLFTVRAAANSLSRSVAAITAPTSTTNSYGPMFCSDAWMTEGLSNTTDTKLSSPKTPQVVTADVLPCGTCTEAASVADVIGNDESDNESAPLACSLNVDNPFLPSRDEGNSAKRRTLRLKTAAADPGSIGLVLMLAMALLLVGWVTR